MFTVWSCLFHFNQYVFTTSEFNEQFYENPSLVYVVLMLFLQLFYFYLYILGVFEAPLFYIETIIPKNIFFCQRTSFISIWNKKKNHYFNQKIFFLQYIKQKVTKQSSGFFSKMKYARFCLISIYEYCCIPKYTIS